MYLPHLGTVPPSPFNIQATKPIGPGEQFLPYSGTLLPELVAQEQTLAISLEWLGLLHLQE